MGILATLNHFPMICVVYIFTLGNHGIEKSDKNYLLYKYYAKGGREN